MTEYMTTVPFSLFNVEQTKQMYLRGVVARNIYHPYKECFEKLLEGNGDQFSEIISPIDSSDIEGCEGIFRPEGFRSSQYIPYSKPSPHVASDFFYWYGQNGEARTFEPGTPVRAVLHGRVVGVVNKKD